jgi:hypothetical protein
MINPERQTYPLLWVEAIIGAGKTTFCREVGSRLHLRVIEEPVKENPYLEDFYKDEKRWAFPMQMFLLERRKLMQQLAAIEATGIGGYKGAILDRSLSGDRVFAKMHMHKGNIHPRDWNTYEESYDGACRSLLNSVKATKNSLKKRRRGSCRGATQSKSRNSSGTPSTTNPTGTESPRPFATPSDDTPVHILARRHGGQANVNTWCRFFSRQPDVTIRIICNGGKDWPPCRDYFLCLTKPYVEPPYTPRRPVP